MSSTQDPAPAPLNGLEIAVIGMAGRFPSAEGIDSFWQLLREGREGLVMLSEDELERAGVAAETRNHPAYVRKRGIISRKRELDAGLFGYTAQDAATMDPQFGVFHEVAWEALENAGYHSSKYDGLIGVYAGASGNLSWVHRVMESGGSMADYYSVASLTDSGFLSTRVAHRLDLTGPAITTNTACSTSLVNVHLACQGLITGDCDIALAGGVSVSIESGGYLYQENMVLSPDGSCRPFDAAANGTASGEGCGVLVLKRLEDAIADNDTVVAVIKGSAVNSDGQRKVGFTAPSSEGQARVIRTALDRAEVEPHTIGYIEAHGTATKLGDPIEIAALTQVFESVAPASCAIGSVKSNIGHLAEAAGVAGAIKAILALWHRTLPPSLNFETPNPLIGLESGPFFVNTQLCEWRRTGDTPLRAGVSSFGIGGTNAHVIFEEATFVPASGPGRKDNLVFLSANTASALAVLEHNLIDHAQAFPRTNIADICYTLHVGRKDLPHRKAFVVTSTQELGARANAVRPFAAEGRLDKTESRLCFLFPGQGTQYRGMGKELYQREPVFRDCMDECFAIARRLSGIDFKAELFPDVETETDAGLARTDLAQPLLFVFEYALATLLQHWGCRPHAYLGHSVGEYVAACLARVFSLEDAIAVVIERGRLVQTLPEGAMLAVPLGEAQVQPLLGAGLAIAAVNSPNRAVVSGDADAIEDLQRQLAAQGNDSVRLHTSHAFHSHHLDPVLEDFARMLRSVRLSAPRVPFLSNVTGTWISDEEATSPDYWVRHLRQAVRFADCIDTLCRDDAQVLVEVGPGQTLTAFAMQHATTAPRKHCVSLVPQARAHVPGADGTCLFEGLCQLFVAGVELDWKRFYEGRLRRRIPLATYPFEGHCHYPAELLRQSPPSSRPAAQLTAIVDTTRSAATVDGASDEGEVSVQSRLLAIWKNYLGTEEIAVDDDVFDLGVDSLLSIRVITEIRETFKADISLDTIFVLRTVAEQAAEIARKIGTQDPASIPPVRPYQHAGLAPLSTSQRRLWIISQLERDQTAYNAGSCMFVKGANSAVLERAFRTVIQRHSILRTVYTEVDGEPMQQVRDTFEFHLDHADISHLDPAHRDSEGEGLWQQALQCLIDLRTDLMLRAKLVRYDDDRHLLIVTLHHICSDNWSNNVLMTEIGTLYDAYLAGEEDPLPPLPVQYIDYALWQHEWLRNTVLEQQLPYWRKTLAGIPHVHNLPLDRPRPKYQSYRGKLHSTRVDASVLDGINRLGQQHGATLFMTMQAAFSAFLGRYSGETDIVLGFSVANRLQKELEGLIGFFVNPLVLRSDLSGNPTFIEFLAQTKKNLLGTYANSHVPFESLVAELKPPRSMSYEPIIQIKLIYLDQSQVQGGRGATRADQESVTYADMHVPYSKYDLTVYFSVANGALALNWEYATDLFESETIARMADNFETLLRSIVAAPSQAIRNLALLAEPEIRRQLRDSNSDGQHPGAPLAPNPAHAITGDVTRSDTAFEFSLFYFASDDGGRTDDKYRLLMEGARFADRNGFEAVWTPERHFDAFGGAYPNPAITAAALASATNRIKVRAGSCVLPLHNPVRVAEDWSVIDNLSGGRVGIGFAAGYSPSDFTLAPDKFETRRDVLIRDVQTVKALWRGDGVMMPNGKGEMVEIKIRPLPIQPELPVWVTTVGSEEAFRHAGRMGDNVLTHLMGQSLEDLTRKIVIYREERAVAGHPGSGTITLLVHTFIADNEQMIFDVVKEPFKQYLIDSVGTPQAIATTVGSDPAVDGEGEGRNNDIDAITEFAFRRYYQSNALMGTAERCLPLVQEIRRAGVNEVACLIDFGVDPDLVLESLPRLGRLRDMAIPCAPARVYAQAPAAGALATPGILATEPVLPVVHEADPAQCIHRKFEQRAAADPDAVAVVYEGDQLTYGELNARANRVAHHLIANHGAAPEKRIGLCIGRSVAMIVGLIAILKSGAAYVPMEPDNPPARIDYMLRDGGVDVVLTRTGDDGVLEGTAATRVMLDRDDAFVANEDSNPHTMVSSRHAAYVIYTSGSTGLSKGVVVEHRSAVNFWQVLVATTHSACPAHARVALNASFAFDMSLKGVLQLLSGHCLHVIPQEIRPDGVKLLHFLQRHGIHAFDSTPSQLNVLLAAGLLDNPDYQPISVLLGGEPINAAVWNRLRASTIRFYNMYGPTECTIDATIGLIGEHDATPHIGRPIANAQVYLLDEYGQAVPRGTVGEIHIGGAGVARGYLNQPELTAERFVSDPYSRSHDARLYRTGDMGRWLDDGNLAYLGRNDLQVKLRGFRVELGDIESHLVAHDEVREGAVLAQGEEGAKFLVAYVVPAQGGFDAAALQFELKRALTASLPAYMVPQAFVFMAGLPLNSNGKLDREQLLQEACVRPSSDYLAPRTDTERTLAAIWGELMGLDDISVRANFFELGGQSLVAIRVVNEIVRRLDVELETRYIFEYSTIESLAAYIDTTLWTLKSKSAQYAELSDDEVSLEI